MTAPDANSALGKSVAKGSPAGDGTSRVPAGPGKSTPAVKSEKHNIHVSSAILDAAGKRRKCIASVDAHDPRGPNASRGRIESESRWPERSGAGTPVRLVYPPLDYSSQPPL